MSEGFRVPAIATEIEPDRTVGGTSRATGSLLGCALLCLLASACSPGEHADLLLSNVHVVEARLGVVLSNQDVLVSDGRIIAVVPHGSRRVRADTVVALDDAYVIPGLWDMHAHIRSYEGQDILPMFVAHGVTGIRDLGLTDFGLIRRWQGEIERGVMPGPRIVSSGVIVEGANPRFRSSVSVTAVDQIAPKLDPLVDQGIEIIKLFESVPEPVYRALVSYAKARGLHSAGHTRDQVDAAAIGLGSIEHLRGTVNNIDLADIATDAAALDRFAAALTAANTFQCPTLVNNQMTAEGLFGNDASLVHTPAYHRAWWDSMTPADTQVLEVRASQSREITGQLARRGVKFLAGTDTPNPYLPAGLSLHAELEAFVDAGMTSAEALRTATVNVAEYFHREGEWGLVAPGYDADLVLLHRNPLEDITNTRAIAGVIAKGRYLPKEGLQELKDDHARRMALASPRDFDQAIYMRVLGAGTDGARQIHPDPLNDSNLVVEPFHLLRFS
ncbi:MAG: amidohydrolase family protein [Acidobacteria bacterium]|nr:amidohydrolase family protein [Acidobacteriota bacterium]